MLFIPGPLDADQVLQAAVTKTTGFNGDWMDLGKGFAPGGLGMPAAAVVNTTAIDHTDSNETYTLTMQEADADANGAADAGTVRTISPTESVTATGLSLVKGMITGRFVRLVLAAGGTTPSITYDAYLGV